MEEKLYGSVPYPSEYLQQWIQSAQQLQAIQAQYSGFNPLQQQPHYPVGQVAPQNLKQPHYPTVGQAAENHHQHQYPVRQQQAPENRPQYPVAVGQAEERPVPNMAANPGTLQQEPADLTKPPAKKRGRQAQPKEPKPPKIPKAPKPPKAPKEPKPPKEPKAPGPKAKPGPKSKKAKEGEADGSQPKVDETFKKVRRKVDRFKGMSEEEVMTKTLPDLLEYNLDYVIIGINPGLMAAFIGRWFPGPGNHFWKCLFLSGFTDELLNHTSDTVLPGKYKIGFTNMVARATPGSKDLSTKELREGGVILTEKLIKYKPLIAVFNGKCIYEMFCREMFGKKPKTLQFGLQPHKIPDCDVALYLMPSSSARCAQFPRAQDKVHFYIKLRELRDTLKGVQKAKEIEEVHYSFDLGLAKEDAKRMAIKEEQYDPGYEDAYGGAYALPGAAEAAGPPQTNGHCKFSDAENTGSSDKATTSQTDPPAEGNLPDIQMSQSFTDQIPDIAGGPTEASV